jgi:hypothetical protein
VRHSGNPAFRRPSSNLARSSGRRIWIRRVFTFCERSDRSKVGRSRARKVPASAETPPIADKPTRPRARPGWAAQAGVATTGTFRQLQGLEFCGCNEPPPAFVRRLDWRAPFCTEGIQFGRRSRLLDINSCRLPHLVGSALHPVNSAASRRDSIRPTKFCGTRAAVHDAARHSEIMSPGVRRLAVGDLRHSILERSIVDDGDVSCDGVARNPAVPFFAVDRH